MPILKIKDGREIFCETGANVVAGLVANAVKSQKINGLYGYVK